MEKHIKKGPGYGATVGLHLALAITLAAPAMAESGEELDVGNGRFVVEWRGQYSTGERDKLKNWLRSVAITMKKLHGTFPRERIRIVLEQFTSARYRSDSAVPFARVLRGRNQGILFYVNPESSLEDFIRDWTAYHEFTHLFIPFPGRADIWFSEGLASYYQNVLQYRGGLLTEEEAWQKLYDGFERGRADDGNAGYTLTELCINLRETHAFMRVYWTGALYFLEADLRLRKLGKNSTSLDEVLEKFGRCCLDEHKDWRGIDIAVEFDRIAGSQLFVPLYKRFEKTTAIPYFMPVLNAAGISVTDGRVNVSSDTLMNRPPRQTD